ncbi:MAG TPA: hypothetical protein VKX33_05540 [Cyclobacteriaceae bacterium]|nr:hypothetical protein [Cyclobacteriaceae bacterium]
MKKLFLLLFMGVISTSLFAQKGHNQASIGAEVGLPTGSVSNSLNLGFGGTAKGLYGVGDAGQVGFTLGFIRYGFDGAGSGVSAGMNVIPIMPGYRHHFDNLYAEGQVGLAIVKSSFNYGGYSASASTTNASIGIGGGYLYENFDISLRYQGYGTGFGTLGLRVAYNFSLNI